MNQLSQQNYHTILSKINRNLANHTKFNQFKKMVLVVGSGIQNHKLVLHLLQLFQYLQYIYIYTALPR